MPRPRACHAREAVEVVDGLGQQPAEVDGVGRGEARTARSGSAKARLTRAWQSSNLPAHRQRETLSPSVVICLRWRPRDLLDGEENHDHECDPGRRSMGDGEPVSPEVAVRMTKLYHPARKYRMSRAMRRAAKSLKEQVGPRSSLRMYFSS